MPSDKSIHDIPPPIGSTTIRAVIFGWIVALFCLLGVTIYGAQPVPAAENCSTWEQGQTALFKGEPPGTTIAVINVDTVEQVAKFEVSEVLGFTPTNIQFIVLSTMNDTTFVAFYVGDCMKSNFRMPSELAKEFLGKLVPEEEWEVIEMPNPRA